MFCLVDKVKERWYNISRGSGENDKGNRAADRAAAYGEGKP